MHTLILSSNLQLVTSCLTFPYSVSMHVMRKYNTKPQRICSFFHFKWIYWFFRIHMNCFNFFYAFENSRVHITHKNFSHNWTNSCTIIGSIFFRNRYFYKRKKNWKNSCVFWKINKFICNEKNTGSLIIYQTIIFFTYLLITFRHYNYSK